MSKRTAMKDRRGVLDAFLEPSIPEAPVNDDKTSKHQNVLQSKQQIDLERATVYLRPEQHDVLENLKIQLRQRKVKTNKSSLVRVAIDYLASQSADDLIDILTKHQDTL